MQDFLDRIALILSRLSSCGTPISDQMLFLTIIQKLPTSMRGLFNTIMWGSLELKTHEHLERSLSEYAKNFPVKAIPHSANSIRDSELRCQNFKLSGHSKIDWRTDVWRKYSTYGHHDKHWRSWSSQCVPCFSGCIPEWAKVMDYWHGCYIFNLSQH